MGTAVGALDLRPPHEQTPILLLPYAFFVDRRPETRPARSGVVLRPCGEELLPAYDACVDAGLVVVPVLSGEGSLGPLVDANFELQRRELLPELRLVDRLHEDELSLRPVLSFR